MPRVSWPSPPDSRFRRQNYHGIELASDSTERDGEPDFALGLAPSPEILARLTIRRRVDSVLDLGTGTGIQALLASRHAARVVGVDVNERALAWAVYNAAANGIENVEWRHGSWFDPVRGERFGLVVANPPYVVSPDGVLYRDSADGSDAPVFGLLREAPGQLEEGGFAQVLCSWVARDGWRRPIDGAVAGSGCDAVVLLYAEYGPEEYARLWNRHLEHRDAAAFDATVGRWLAFYAERGIDRLAFGLVVLRRRSAERNWIRAFRVPAGPTEGAGEHVERLFSGWDAVREGVGAPAGLVPGARLVRRVDLETGAERSSLEVRPNVGFAAPVSAETAALLAEGGELPAAERRRLLGLGMLSA